MKIYGIDFTSRPKRSKPITCLVATLEGNLLHADRLSEWQSFEEFEQGLRRPAPWIAGIDFPFGQSRTFIENIGWPENWRSYVLHARRLGREGFRVALDNYRANRPVGDKEHRRATDIAAGSISPQTLYGTPVGLMFFEGASRLIDAGVTIPELQEGDRDRVVVEAYPGVLARGLIGRRSYKNDTKKKQTQVQYEARQEILHKIKSGALIQDYNLKVQASDALADDPTGDELDALLCAIQAAWAWKQPEGRYGAPDKVNSLEGWIADPAIAP